MTGPDPVTAPAGRRPEDGSAASARPEPAAAGILAAAFGDDPLFAALFPARAARVVALGDWFGAACAGLARCRSGRVRVDGPAALAWTVATCAGCLADLDDALVAVAREHAGERGPALLGAARDVTGPLAPDAWFLHWFGVRPGCRGSGAGGRALGTVVAAAHADHRPLATTTVNPQVVPLYARAGLVPVGPPTPLPGLPDMLCWTLQTAPPAAAGRRGGEDAGTRG